MRALLVISLLIFVVSSTKLYGSKASNQSAEVAPEDGKIWALLVAGSNRWMNYRHQADVCHSFHVLKNHGVPEENIVTMMYDDIANNPANPYPGKIFNRPNGPDVYAGVKIDYKGAAVNPDNFLAVLQGQQDKVNGGNGRVLNTTSKDKVFVYFTDHGAPGLVIFGEDVLTVKQLNSALQSMHDQNRFGQLVFYMEACESGSMFEKVLPSNINVYALTAANAHEPSFAAYCGASAKLSICLGDLFSVNWLEDSEKKNLHNETLESQFELVKQRTEKSHVKRYGQLAIAEEPVADFQGEKIAPTVHSNDDVHNYESWAVHDIPIKSLEVKLRFINDANRERSILNRLAKMKYKREYLKNHTEALVKKLIPDKSTRQIILNRSPPAITKLDCHHNIVHAYNRICFNFGSNPYATQFVKVLANLCEYGLDSNKIIHTLMGHCLDILHKNIL